MSSQQLPPLHLLAGGNRLRRKGPDPLLQQVMASSGQERPSLAYVGAASRDNRLFFLLIKKWLRQAGAGEVYLVPLASARSSVEQARAMLNKCAIVFISGGDVAAGMRLLEKRGLVTILKELHAAGKPFFGLSAGSIMLAQSWVRWAKADDDATAEAFPCLGLAPLICDTHAEEDDWAELKMLMKLTRADIGYGIPSAAGLQVNADGSVAALGKPVQRFAIKDGQAVRVADLSL